MAKEKAPAYQRYPKDYLSDLNTQVMTLEEEGMYARLMDYCWLEVVLPDDPEALAAICKGKEPTSRVLKCFVKIDGGYRHKRLDEERDKQEDHRKRSAKGGRASAHKRKHIKENGIEQGGCPLVATNKQPKGNSSSSFASANKKNNPPVCPPGDTCTTADRDIFDFWLSFPVLHRHKAFEPTDQKHVLAALQVFKPPDIKTAIERYATVLEDETGKYWLDVRWTIGEFVSRKARKWITVFVSDDWENQLIRRESRASPSGGCAPDTVGAAPAKDPTDPKDWYMRQWVEYALENGMSAAVAQREQHQVDWFELERLDAEVRRARPGVLEDLPHSWKVKNQPPDLTAGEFNRGE